MSTRRDTPRCHRSRGGIAISPRPNNGKGICPLSNRLAASHALFLGTLIGSSLQAQAQDPVRIDNVRWLAEALSSPRGVASLGSDRLVVTDARERRLVLFDLARGSARDLSREGAGPGEFRAPGGVAPGRGGTVWMYDAQLARFLEIRPDGSVRVGPRIPEEVGASRIRMVGDGGQDQWVTDTLGNFYTLALDPNNLPASLFADSLPLVRVNGQGQRRTVAWIRQPERQSSTNTGQIMAGQMVRFAPEDAWQVSPDGWVAVVRGAPYRVEWFPPNGGERRIGPVVPTPVIRVSDAERRALSAPRTGRGPSVTVNGQARQLATSGPPPMREVKPAFPPQAPRIDGLGRLWVRRHAINDSLPPYDVFDRTGRIVARFAFPSSAFLIGFHGARPVLMREDADGVANIGIGETP